MYVFQVRVYPRLWHTPGILQWSAHEHTDLVIVQGPSSVEISGDSYRISFTCIVIFYIGQVQTFCSVYMVTLLPLLLMGTAT